MTDDTPAAAVAATSVVPVINLERQSTVVQNAAAVTTDVTRRMICGGLAGMIAKVCSSLV
jgi:phosphohistidine swiveling domain-containing protein